MLTTISTISVSSFYVPFQTVLVSFFASPYHQIHQTCSSCFCFSHSYSFVGHHFCHRCLISASYLATLWGWQCLSECFNELHWWYSFNGLKLNPDKSEAILIWLQARLRRESTSLCTTTLSWRPSANVLKNSWIKIGQCFCKISSVNKDHLQ